MDFERIDINQCPKGQGNIGPNRFASTARCKTDTTEVCNFNFFASQQSDKIYVFSVSHWTAGDSGEADINVGVRRSIDYRA